MRKLFLGAVALSALVIFAVGCKKVENKVVDAVSTMDSVGSTLENVAGDEMGMDMTDATMQYFGIYEGTIPAASGPGIKMTLTLNPDYTFTLVSEYIDSKEKPFTDKGTYTAEKGIINATLQDNSMRYFKIGDKQLMLLNDQKEPAEGDMAKEYILNQTKAFEQPEVIN